MDFIAELKEAKSKKSVSNDMVYRVVFETDNPMVLDLGKLAGETLFDVSVNINDTRGTKTKKDDVENWEVKL